MSPGCESWHESMTVRLFGESDEFEEHLLDEHLAQCSDCQMHWAQLTEHFDTLRAQPRPRGREKLASLLLERLAPELEIAPATASERAENLAEIASAQGEVLVRARGEERWSGAVQDAALSDGDSVQVGPGGRALLRLPDRSELWLNAETVVSIGRREVGQFVRLLHGEVLALLERQEQELQFRTADGQIAVLGTVFNVRLRPGHGTRVSVLQGRVRVATDRQSREVGPRRQMDFRAGQSVKRSRWLSATESRRIGEWTEPLSAVSRASERQTLNETRRKPVMITLRKVIFVFAMATVALLIYLKLKPSALDPIAQRAQETQAEIDQVTPIEITEPITLNHIPRAGDTWTQTSLMRGHAEQHTSGSGRAYEMEIRLTAEARAREGFNPGEIIVDHTITSASIAFTNPAWPEEVRERSDESLRERESSLLRAEMRETLDANGQRLGMEISAPDMPPHSSIGMEMIAISLFTSPPSVGAPQLSAGSTWVHTDRLPSIPGIPFEQLNTVEHLEDLNGERVAVVRSEGDIQFQANGGPSIDLGSETVSGMGTATFALQRLLITWRGEDRYRLRDGRRMMTTGHSHQGLDLRIVSREVSGRVIPEDLTAVQDLDVTTWIEYH